jgi:hypothetical protein
MPRMAGICPMGNLSFELGVDDGVRFIGYNVAIFLFMHHSYDSDLYQCIPTAYQLGLAMCERVLQQRLPLPEPRHGYVRKH